jgi:hypothetical protein
MQEKRVYSCVFPGRAADSLGKSRIFATGNHDSSDEIWIQTTVAGSTHLEKIRHGAQLLK